jgi:hypothetical protein
MTRDARGWRMALVPDALVNPPPDRGRQPPDVVSMLAKQGYGLMQLPAQAEPRLLLAVLADQIAEFAHHGYAVVAVGAGEPRADGLHWRRMTRLLRDRGVALPPRHIIALDRDAELEAKRLEAFLAAYDVPIEAQRRWRS